MQLDPTEAMLASQETLHSLQVCPRGPSVPCDITALILLARAFKHINLKASGKDYACWECDKTSSNWDTMVSHYLQEHLGAV